MTTTIEVNVFGYDPKWKDGTNHKYYTGKFVYQHVAPQGQQLMDTKGNLNLAEQAWLDSRCFRRSTGG